MIDRNHALPITRQAELVGISRGNVYYLPRGRLAGRSGADEAHRRAPPGASLRGQPHAARHAQPRGLRVGRRHVATLMQRMGIEALYRKPNTSKKAPDPQDLSVPAARAEDRSRQPGLGERHHLHPDGVRLGLSVRRSSTGPAASAVAPGVDQHGRRVLRGGARGGLRQVRQARDLQLRPGQPVHQRGRSPRR